MACLKTILSLLAFFVILLVIYYSELFLSPGQYGKQLLFRLVTLNCINGNGMKFAIKHEDNKEKNSGISYWDIYLQVYQQDNNGFRGKGDITPSTM